MATIAIFGGSFNPPHLGHQALCLMLLEACAVDAVWLVPTYRHYFGKDLADFEQRLQMCTALVRPLGSRALVCEVEREIGAEPSRMLDTLKELGRRHPNDEFRLVVGADILAERSQWHQWSEVIKLAPVLVFERHGYPGGDLPAPPDVSSTEIRKRIRAGKTALPLVPKSVQACITAEKLYL